MPALEMAQETGKVLRWLKAEGDPVAKGEPIMEIETDKVTVEIEAPAAGLLGGISAHEGDSVPVGRTIAWILAPGEKAPVETAPLVSGRTSTTANVPARPASQPVADTVPSAAAPVIPQRPLSASPVALQIAREHGIDLARLKPQGGRVEKADVLAFIANQTPHTPQPGVSQPAARLVPASPAARRLAAERGLDITLMQVSGPERAVHVADVMAAAAPIPPAPTPEPLHASATLSTVWRVMSERMSTSWTTAPHFHLTREVAASGLIELRTRLAPLVEKQHKVKITYTDLLVKLFAVALSNHRYVNARSTGDGLAFNDEVNVGIAIAIDDGLIVPVVHQANEKSLGDIAAQRHDLVARAKEGKLRPADISGGTSTLTNLGMYNVDAFSAIINPPQGAILATGRIADRVVAVNGQPAVRPMMTLTLACDHRVVDGARAALFLDDLANSIEEPYRLLI